MFEVKYNINILKINILKWQLSIIFETYEIVKKQKK
jgi:hypothetical protein